ncbi:MAG: exosortase/archaeosortase family protein [Candidatus Altiarchaeota archaeon]
MENPTRNTPESPQDADKTKFRLDLIATMVVGFTGLRILLLSSYQSKPLGLLLSLAGLYYLRSTFRPEKLEKRKTLMLPAAGVLLIISDLIFNLLSAGSLDLKGFDQMAIIFGVILISYNYIPLRYEREARFLGIFFGMFLILQVVPVVLHSGFSLLTGSRMDMEESAVWYVENFLGIPLKFALNLMGIETKTEGNILSFRSVEDWTSVRIGIACSGAYSFAIFTSAFTAYVLTKYKKHGRRTIMLLAVGVFMTYLANIFRMLTLVLSGYFFGGKVMVKVHEDLGWVIFMLWTLFFWTVMFKILPEE